MKALPKIAVMSVNYCHYSLDYFIRSMSQCGVRNIDFWGAIPHYCRLDYKNGSEAGRKLLEIRNKFSDGGMDVVVYTPETLSYPYSLSSPEKAVRERTLDYFRMSMEDASGLGTDKLFINSGCGLLDLPREESWKRTVDSINMICTEAESNGITMVLEQLQPYESNLVTTLPDLAAMLKDVDSGSLGVCVDVVAMAVAGEKLEDYFKTFGRKIELIHLADGDPSGHYILGDGNLDIAHYLDVLKANSYSGIITLEINDSIYWQDPHDSIKRSVEYLSESNGGFF